MITSARITEELRPAGLDWITALRAPQIKALVQADALQLSLFDEHDLAEINSPDYPGERLVCCHNPALAQKRTQKRQDLLAATEKQLTAITDATTRTRRPLRGKDDIALRVGKVINHYKMAKHFHITITDNSFTFTRNEDAIAAEAALDGIYVLRTNLPKSALGRDDVVLRYKGLEDVERFFRTLNSELDVRPIRHHLADRVRAHMFLRMLSYYISWHMKQALAPLLFRDHDKPAAAAKRTNPLPRSTFRCRPSQSLPQTHHRRHPGAQLHQPARRPSHHLRQPHPARRRHAHVHQIHHPHRTTTPRLRTTRPHPPPGLQVVMQTTQNPRSRHTHHQTRGNYGLIRRVAKSDSSSGAQQLAKTA
ncbi:hypothetical protein MBOU_53490 [Mycobacterium bourgelatii]|uniref:Transposase n=1 Tax=Mycobacterium bourgelatii TaxID=1273442 RepID=A0A7I9YXP3_MYCBU|nr:hypothetical protein MBOU_53490 [Mycobacterium bourgelatii]